MDRNFLLRAIATFLVLLAGLGMHLASALGAHAAEEQPPGPDRYEAIQEQYTRHFWWLTRWTDNQVACEIVIEHSGLPTAGEIYAACGTSLYKQWLATQACPSGDTTCAGYYLFLAKSEEATRQVGRALPPPVVWLHIAGCEPHFSSYRCEDLPALILVGEEPLRGHSILALHGSIDGKAFTCTPTCRIDLGPTDEDGILLRFWAESSYGDTSHVYQARLRLARKEGENDRWYLDVLSDRLRNATPAPCALLWERFPPVGGLTGWLATPDTPDALASNIPYEYLAGQLIRSGAVNANTCPDGGLQPNGYATVCGLEAARTALEAWQNRFDRIIWQTAREVGVPAQLLKNLFSQESQFWPGISPGRPEAGLGQLTENGADTTLLWNRPFYEQFCPSVLDLTTCQKGYPHLSAANQARLRTALVQQVDAFCADCPLGIDIEKAEASILIFAETLLANCAQMEMVLSLNYPNPKPPPSYEDLWRFTLVNYHAGPGCLGLAIHATHQAREPLTWSFVQTHFTPACRGAIEYVSRITSSP